MKLKYAVIFTLLLALLLLPASARAQEPTPSPEDEDTQPAEPQLEPVETPDAIFAQPDDGQSEVVLVPPSDEIVTLPPSDDTYVLEPAEESNPYVAWAIFLLTYWAVFSGTISTTLEQVKQRGQPILDLLGLTRGSEARAFSLVIFVFVAAFISSQGVDIFANAPDLVWDYTSDFSRTLITTFFLASGAFLFHRQLLRDKPAVEESAG